MIFLFVVTIRIVFCSYCSSSSSSFFSSFFFFFCGSSSSLLSHPLLVGEGSFSSCLLVRWFDLYYSSPSSSPLSPWDSLHLPHTWNNSFSPGEQRHQIRMNIQTSEEQELPIVCKQIFKATRFPLSLLCLIIYQRDNFLYGRFIIIISSFALQYFRSLS